MPTRLVVVAALASLAAGPALAQIQSDTTSSSTNAGGPKAPAAASSSQSATGVNNRVKDPQATGALGPTQAVPVSRLKSLEVVSAGENKRLGQVAGVVADDQGGTYLLVEAGSGVLSLSKKEILIPTQQAALDGSRIVAADLTEEQVQRLPPLDRRARPYRNLDANQTAQVGTPR